MKLEFRGSFFRIVVELFHQELSFSRPGHASGRSGEKLRRRVLRKVIQRIEESTV